MSLMILNHKADKIVRIIAYLTISTVCFMWLSERNMFHENLQTYSPTEINAYDSSIYAQDIDVVTSKGTISPRMGSIKIVSALMYLGLNYEKVYVLLYFITCLIAAVGGVVYVYLADISNKLLGILVYTIMFGISQLHCFAGFYMFTTNSIFIGLGGALGILAVILVMCKPTLLNTNIAYLIVALASVCHIHEGIWSFVFVSFVYILSARKTIPYKCASFYVAIASILVLTIPSVLSGQYAMPTADFFAVYVRERIPHHLLLSYNGWTAILSLVIAWCALIYLNRSRITQKGQYGFYISLVGLFALTLFAWYGFTEVLHIPSFVKLYVAKFVKYISIPFGLLFVSYMDDVATEKKDWFLSISMILCLFTEGDIWLYTLLLVNFVAWLPIDGKVKSIAKISTLIICCILFWKVSCTAPLSLRSIMVGGGMISLLSSSLITTMLFTLLVVFGGGGHIYHHTHSFSSDSYIHYRMEKKVGKDVYQISQSINGIVPQNQVILCDARTTENGFIQHLSRRSMYCLWKTVPSTDMGIKIWHNRIVETKDFCQWTPEQTAEFMREKELQYVTVNTQNMMHSYGDSPLFTKEAEQGDLILYKLQQ